MSFSLTGMSANSHLGLNPHAAQQSRQDASSGGQAGQATHVGQAGAHNVSEAGPTKGPPPPPRGETMVLAYDSNRDGALAKSELSQEDIVAKLLEQFEAADEDSNGLLTANELDNFGRSLDSFGRATGSGELRDSSGQLGPDAQRGPPRHGGPPPPAPSQASAESISNALQDALDQQNENSVSQSILNAMYSGTQNLLS